MAGRTTGGCRKVPVFHDAAAHGHHVESCRNGSQRGDPDHRPRTLGRCNFYGQHFPRLRSFQGLSANPTLVFNKAKDDEISYIVELIDRYRRIDFGKKDFLILRVDAPVAVTYERYLDREKDTPGNKYPPEYMQAIEDSHDACARSWGPYVIYDNSRVAYIRPTSPFDDAGKPTHGSPEDGAVRSVLAELCSLARSMRLTGIRQHMQNSYATADAAARGYQLAAVSRPTTGSATYS